MGEPLGNWIEVLFDDRVNHHNRRGSRWHLRLVEDANGNRIEYEYDTETEEFACRNDRDGRMQFFGDDLHYDRMVYPKTIRWSANAGEVIEPKLRVTFTRESRPDFEIEKDHCDQARFGKERLKSIRIEAWDNPNGWHSIAEYGLGYSQGRHHSLLSHVTRLGKQGRETLRSWHFNYRGSDNAVRLTEADNGLGGSVHYSYGQETIEDCHDCSQVTQTSDAPAGHRGGLARRNRRRSPQRLPVSRHQGTCERRHVRVPGPRLEPAPALHPRQ